MLIRLFGENFRSFRDPFELSFVAADLPAETDRGISLLHPKDSEEPFRVLRCLGVFGANASGKSTVLLAASALKWMIRESSRHLEPKQGIPTYKPFAFCSPESEQPVKLGCTIYHDGVFFEYKIAFSKYRIESECLSRLDTPEAPLFCRNSPTKVHGSLINNSDQIKALLSTPKSNIPIFSFLAQHGPEDGEWSVRPYWDAFCKRLWHRDYSTGDTVQFIDTTAKRIYSEPQFRKWILSHLIQPADLGIRDMEAEEIELPLILSSAPEGVRKQFVEENAPFYRTAFLHGNSSDSNLDIDEESSGTRKMYSLASDWWALAHKSVTILGDELSASLHPLLLDHLVRAVNQGSKKDGINSQLAFATHDVGLMESRDGSPPALRRDQIYFTKKDKDGASSLYSLTEFKNEARSVHNIRKRYLGDRYSAIPRIEELSL